MAELLRENKFRIDFQEKLEKIVDEYNTGSINAEEYFRRLSQMFKDLEEEEKRHIKEGLTNEELAVFDILSRPKLKMTKKDEQQVKATAKQLLEKLKEQKFVLDWKKRTRTRADVQVTIEDVLWDKVPQPPYTPEIKNEKSVLVYQHVYDSYYGSGRSIYSEIR